MFASMSGDEIDELLYNHPLERYTDKTITDPAEYKKVLMKVRKDGWAINDEEYLKGRRCVGAPVYDYSGAVIASIAINGDLEELSDEKLPIIVEAVKNTAALVSKGMGYLP
jgi:DNA-binding IclR family transcriptional regulator